MSGIRRGKKLDLKNILGNRTQRGGILTSMYENVYGLERKQTEQSGCNALAATYCDFVSQRFGQGVVNRLAA